MDREKTATYEKADLSKSTMNNSEKINNKK